MQSNQPWYVKLLLSLSGNADKKYSFKSQEHSQVEGKHHCRTDDKNKDGTDYEGVTMIHYDYSPPLFTCLSHVCHSAGQGAATIPSSLLWSAHSSSWRVRRWHWQAPNRFLCSSIGMCSISGRTLTSDVTLLLHSCRKKSWFYKGRLVMCSYVNIKYTAISQYLWFVYSSILMPVP